LSKEGQRTHKGMLAKGGRKNKKQVLLAVLVISAYSLKFKTIDSVL